MRGRLPEGPLASHQPPAETGAALEVLQEGAGQGGERRRVGEGDGGSGRAPQLGGGVPPPNTQPVSVECRVHVGDSWPDQR